MNIYQKQMSVLLLGILAVTTFTGCSQARDGQTTPPVPLAYGDADGDGLKDNVDNCPSVANADQKNVLDPVGRVDTIGDACDDSDSDGVNDSRDNCPVIANSNQLNNDKAAEVTAGQPQRGDACDDDDDNDGFKDPPGPSDDKCPFTPTTTNTGNECAGDFDNDTIPDSSDNCPAIPNVNQANTAGKDINAQGVSQPDSVGDACDDSDQDGFNDAVDSCPGKRNLGVDSDNDGIDDACDSDANTVVCGGPLSAASVVAVNGAKITVTKTGVLCTLSDTLLASGLNLCGVENPDAIIDANNATYGVINNAVSSALEGVTGTVGVSIKLAATQLNPSAASGAVAFMITPQPSTLELSILRSLRVSTYLNGVQQDVAATQTAMDASALTLEVLGGQSGLGPLNGATGDGNTPIIVGFRPSKSYNEIRLESSAIVLSADVLEGLRVNSAYACASSGPVVVAP